MARQEVHEVPIGSIVQTIRQYGLAIVSKWPWLVFGAVVGGLIGFYLAINTDTTYRASVSFLINEEQGGLPGVGGLLGDIGLGSGSSYNLDKVLALSKSYKILSQVVLDSADAGGEMDLVGNHVIDIQNLDEEWELAPTFRLDADSLDEMNDLNRALARSVMDYVATTGVLRVEADETTGIFTLNSEFNSEDLSYHCALKLYDVLSAFYTAQSTSGKQATVLKLRAKADSLDRLLQSKETELASRSDTRLGVYQSRERLRETRLTREIPLIIAAYGEVITNLEVSSFALSTSTPFFQTVDLPFKPLPKVSANPIIQSAVGAVIACVLTALAVVFVQFAITVSNQSTSVQT